MAFGAGADVERLDLAVKARRFLGGDTEGVDQAGDFSFRILDRLAGLDTERIGEFVESFAEARDAMVKHRLPLIACHSPHRLGRSHRSRYPFLDGRRIDRKSVV